MTTKIIKLEHFTVSQTLGTKFAAYKQKDVVIIKCSCGNVNPITSDFVRKIERAKEQKDIKNVNDVVCEIVEYSTLSIGALFIKLQSNKPYVHIKLTSSIALCFFPSTAHPIFLQPTNITMYNNDKVDKILYIHESCLKPHIPEFMLHLYKNLTKKQKQIKETTNEPK